MSHYDPLDLRSQERETASATERDREAEALEVEDLKWLLSDKRGRRYAFRLLERARVWVISFDTNALTMAFKEGRRNEGLRVLDLISTHCPKRYTEMLEENKV